MPRLLPGENAKIDNINSLVEMARGMDKAQSTEGLRALLEMFQPMILKICKKWSEYFQDSKHTMVGWDEIVADAQYWFIEYTLNKYIPDGRATYNKFIKDHLDQRIRYIYETHLKYKDKHIFPDPDKNATQSGDSDSMDMLEEVINKYSSRDYTSMDDMLVNTEHIGDINEVCGTILSHIDNDRYFSEREAQIFKECIVGGKTHGDMANELRISRARVSQIVYRIRGKIFDILDDNVRGWEQKIK